MKRGLIFVALSMIVLALAANAHEEDEFDCSQLEIHSRNTQDLLLEVQELDEQIKLCSPELIRPLSALLKNAMVLMTVNMNTGDNENLLLTIKDGHIYGVELTDSQDAEYQLEISECLLDNVLGSENQIGAMAYIYRNKRVSLKANGFGSRMKLMLLRPFIKMGMKKFQTPVSLDC